MLFEEEENNSDGPVIEEYIKSINYGQSQPMCATHTFCDRDTGVLRLPLHETSSRQSIFLVGSVTRRATM